MASVLRSQLQTTSLLFEEQQSSLVEFRQAQPPQQKWNSPFDKHVSQNNLQKKSLQNGSIERPAELLEQAQPEFFAQSKIELAEKQKRTVPEKKKPLAKTQTLQTAEES